MLKKNRTRSDELRYDYHGFCLPPGPEGAAQSGLSTDQWTGQKIRAADTARQKTAEQQRRQAYLEAYGEIDQTTIDSDLERYRIQMLSNPKLLHDKGCAAYPCLMDVWCNCGLEDFLVHQFFDEYGDTSPWELPCPQCGSPCAGTCQPVPPQDDQPANALLFGREG